MFQQKKQQLSVSSAANNANEYYFLICLFVNAACCSLNDRLSVSLASSKKVKSINRIEQKVKFNFTTTPGDVQEN